MVRLPEDGHHPGTNQASCTVTSLTRPTRYRCRHRTDVGSLRQLHYESIAEAQGERTTFGQHFGKVTDKNGLAHFLKSMTRFSAPTSTYVYGQCASCRKRARGSRKFCCLKPKGPAIEAQREDRG